MRLTCAVGVEEYIGPVGADLAFSMKVSMDGNGLACTFLLWCPISVVRFPGVSSILTSALSSGVWMPVVTVSCSSAGVP